MTMFSLLDGEISRTIFTFRFLKIYMYIYLFVGSLRIDFSVYSARHLGVEHDICCDRGKKNRDYTFIPTSLFRDCSLNKIS